MLLVQYYMPNRKSINILTVCVCDKKRKSKISCKCTFKHTGTQESSLHISRVLLLTFYAHYQKKTSLLHCLLRAFAHHQKETSLFHSLLWAVAHHQQESCLFQALLLTFDAHQQQESIIFHVCCCWLSMHINSRRVVYFMCAAVGFPCISTAGEKVYFAAVGIPYM